PLVEHLDTLQPRLERAPVLLLVTGRAGDRAHRHQDPLLVVDRDAEGGQVGADLLLVDAGERQLVRAGAALLARAALQPRLARASDRCADPAAAHVAGQQACQGVGARPAGRADALPSLLPHGLDPLPQRLVEAVERGVLARRPADLQRPPAGAGPDLL